jgi:hypothetical protein
MEEEIWKPIKDLESVYEVSNLGRLKSLKRLTNSCYNSKRSVGERIITQHLNPKGYQTVCISINGKHFTKPIHRYVAKLFVSGETKEKWQVNHKDGNKLNNNANNLEWITPRDNIIHAYRNELNKGRGNEVIGIDINGDVHIFRSSLRAELYLKKIGYKSASYNNILKNIKGLRHSAYNHKWFTKQQYENNVYKIKE